MTESMATSVSVVVPQTPLEIRERLVEALQLDLVGPWPGHELADEMLPGWIRPSSWYLTGFLVPEGAPAEQRADPDEDDVLEEVPEAAGLAEESDEERKAASRAFFPSSVGLSFLIPDETERLDVVVTWGDYEHTEFGEGEGDPVPVWQRLSRQVQVTVAIPEEADPIVIGVPDSGGMGLYVVQRPTSVADRRLPRGVRSISVFLVNQRVPDPDQPDPTYAFQAQIEVRSDQPFIPRPDPRGALAEEWDELVADLHYADTPEYATGHGVSADWDLVDGVCHLIRSTWIPRADVEKTEASQIPDVEVSMQRLGELQPVEVEEALAPLVERYRTWIEERKQLLDGMDGPRRQTGEELLRLAGVAAGRIERGIEVLTSDPDALDAFRIANRAVARALRQRLAVSDPKWRVFQLAFILLNLPGLADPDDAGRENVDLLFFPTGGGKTEAYLGLAGFTMVLRRLRHLGDGGVGGAGVSVIMRYTLRLLTLDQLSRAAGLVCALELEREQDEDRYGSWPFEIGLWVGKAATPNILGKKGDGRSDSARAKVRQFKADPKGKPSPIPLETCPWCGTRFGPDSFSLLPNDDYPIDLKVVCVNFECDFTRDRALPIVAVDEPIYRRLPAFLIATLDKFASLPWVGPSGMLLGGAERHDKNGFYGASDSGQGTLLATPLPPPDLIIQDELHLISGPLGTMAGLYETAIEAVMVREGDDGVVRPKIVASTATVRRAHDQIQALFARPSTQVFPPQGPDRRDSFFAQTVSVSQAPARRYVGVSAQGRSPKVAMRKVWLALMGAAARAYREAGGDKNLDNPADPYMTVVGYFNSLKELGGARRILEEEVHNTIQGYGGRRRIGGDPGLFQNRRVLSEVLELTSRVSTDKVAEARRRMECVFHEPQRVDNVIATNMISVGLDIPRLGSMVVLGQPKTHAEYIQATSRVGRDDQRPGLVVTLLNIHKPRDRSHYERFRHYHETFYRSVEVSSVTPFSPRALDRGLAGALVTFARQGSPTLTPPRGAERLEGVRAEVERRLLDVFGDRIQQQPFASESERQERLRSVQNRIVDLLDSWVKVHNDYAGVGVQMQYQRYELSQPRPLLREMLEREFESEHHRKFRVNRSLRDVEPNVNLFLKELTGHEVAD
jgi:hypothetical protein